jgi:hypothetical protein
MTELSEEPGLILQAGNGNGNVPRQLTNAGGCATLSESRFARSWLRFGEENEMKQLLWATLFAVAAATPAWACPRCCSEPACSQPAVTSPDEPTDNTMVLAATSGGLAILAGTAYIVLRKPPVA